jgi:hypothetical protein
MANIDDFPLKDAIDINKKKMFNFSFIEINLFSDAAQEFQWPGKIPGSTPSEFEKIRNVNTRWYMMFSSVKFNFQNKAL